MSSSGLVSPSESKPPTRPMSPSELKPSSDKPPMSPEPNPIQPISPEPKPPTEPSLNGPMAQKPKKPKKLCRHQECTYLSLRIVGHCPHCNTDFCGEHRLPEAHECAKLEDCRLEAFNKNKTRLERERTIASKMAVA